MVFTNLITLVASLALLIKSSDYFVKAASSLRQDQIIIGNVVGSNIANISLDKTCCIRTRNAVFCSAGVDHHKFRIIVIDEEL